MQGEYREIYIDKNGIWFYRGIEMERKDIIQYFYNYLKQDERGDYLVEIGNDRCYVDVEDTPYLIRSVSVGFAQELSQPHVDLFLNDGSTEWLNLSAPLRIGDDHALYCRVKQDEHEARFSRPAYYQLCEHITYDSRRKKYLLILGQESYLLNLTKNRNEKIVRGQGMTQT